MYKIAVIEGDGIGPEVIREAIKVLVAVSKKHNLEFSYEYCLAGGASIDKFNAPLTKDTINICKESDSVLLGAVGGPKWDNLPGSNRPERALLGLRSSLGLYGNLRPAILYPELSQASPLKGELIENGIDIMVVRELTGGIYFGKRDTYKRGGEEVSYDIEEYSTSEIERIARLAFKLAKERGKNSKITSVDKANVLDSSRLWRKVVKKVGEENPEVKLNNMYVDNCAMQLIRQPSQFDIILTSNIFGDILSDEASQLTGSIGMLPSASIGDNDFGMYEPIHGSAPDIAGKNIANPIATILSAALMLRYSLKENEAALEIENAVKEFISKGYRTFDLGGEITTSQCGDIICELISK